MIKAARPSLSLSHTHTQAHCTVTRNNNDDAKYKEVTISGHNFIIGVCDSWL